MLAGLVLLGTVLASAAVARGRFMRQWAQAERRLQATRAVDAMLADWTRGGWRTIPTSGRGRLADVEGCYWRATKVADRTAGSLGATVVRVEVVDTAAAASRAEDEAVRAERPLVVVELMVRDQPRETGAAPEGR